MKFNLIISSILFAFFTASLHCFSYLRSPLIMTPKSFSSETHFICITLHLSAVPVTAAVKSYYFDILVHPEPV